MGPYLPWIKPKQKPDPEKGPDTAELQSWIGIKNICMPIQCHFLIPVLRIRIRPDPHKFGPRYFYVDPDPDPGH